MNTKVLIIAAVQSLNWKIVFEIINIELRIPTQANLKISFVLKKKWRVAIFPGIHSFI